MSAKRYQVHGTFIEDYSQTQTTVEMVMAARKNGHSPGHQTGEKHE